MCNLRYPTVLWPSSLITLYEIIKDWQGRTASKPCNESHCRMPPQYTRLKQMLIPKLTRLNGKDLKVYMWQNSRFVEMNTKVVGILAMLLVTTLFVAPAFAAFVAPTKPGSTGNSFSYSNTGSIGSSFGVSSQWNSLSGINPNDPSSMAVIASQIQNMNLRPSPQRPFSWTPYCRG